MTRLSPQELLRRAGIPYIVNARDGKYTTTCPSCRGKNLSVKYDSTDVSWCCDGCGFSRPPRAQTDGGTTPIADATALRRGLAAAGYCPIPLYGKVPPAYGKNNPHGGLAGWQKLTTRQRASTSTCGRARGPMRSIRVCSRATFRRSISTS